METKEIYGGCVVCPHCQRTVSLDEDNKKELQKDFCTEVICDCCSEKFLVEK